MINLTRAEAAAVAQMIEFNLFDSIRNDTEIDNLQWLAAMVHAWEKLDAASREPEEPKKADSGSTAKDKTEDDSKRRGRKPAGLTQEQKLKAVGLRRKGMTPTQIAKAIDAPVSAVKAFDTECAELVKNAEAEEVEESERKGF